MRCTDDERVKKVYKYALELQEYITSHRVQKEDLLEQPMQWLVATPLSKQG